MCFDELNEELIIIKEAVEEIKEGLFDITDRMEKNNTKLSAHLTEQNNHQHTGIITKNIKLSAHYV